MDRHPEDLDRHDVESLAVMSRIHLTAVGQDTGSVVTGMPAASATLTDQARTALAEAERARTLLHQQYVVGPTRLALPKRIVLRLSRLFTHRLVGAGLALADAVDSLVLVHREALDEVERLGNSLQAQVVSVEMASQNALETLASSVLGAGDASETATERAVAGFEATVALVEGRLVQIERERNEERAEVRRLLVLVHRLADAPGAGAPQRHEAGENGPDLTETAYVKFERRFRGSREEIRERQIDALRFVEPLIGASAPLLDLGCGRGEWLEVLRNAGITAYGVDSNEGMVAEAQGLGLDARAQDALAHLEHLPESSLQAVSAFHFVEHVPLRILTRVLDAAFVALREGGLLLLETPNPTNLVVGSAAFYLDPTHLRPLHPDYLQFLVEACGFTDVEVHFVHPAIDERQLREGAPGDAYDGRLRRVVESAEWALFGPQDYLVVGRRGATA